MELGKGQRPPGLGFPGRAEELGGRGIPCWEGREPEEGVQKASPPACPSLSLQLTELPTWGPTDLDISVGPFMSLPSILLSWHPQVCL